MCDLKNEQRLFVIKSRGMVFIIEYINRQHGKTQ
jgi:hypothetical protein